MNRFYSFRIFILLALWSCISAHPLRAQILTPTYPASAQGLTRALDQTLLSVQIGFSSACTGNTVTVSFPASVTYVAGSVTKTGGTLSGATISESNISNLSAPQFSISSVTGAGDITFTIMRQAGCGGLANGKDTIRVAGSCGTASESSGAVNTYNILYPALSITPPPATTGAFVGDVATRTTTITNGGNGCTDTVRFYMVYPSTGIALTSTGNAITANGNSFMPWKTNGDTLFYKIYGSTLFGGDSLLCNGETITISEPMKLLKCGTTTTYAAYWGKSATSGCQTATGTSSITMATGAASPSVSGNEPTIVGACTPGTLTATFSNTGTGGKAGAMYNVVASLGFVSSGQLTMTKGGGFTITSASVNGTAMTLTQTGNNPYLGNASQFTSDPDGVGVGLDDLDGDGQYDDLAPGKSFTVSYTRTYIINNTNCPNAVYADQPGALVSYTSMCGTPSSTVRTVWNNYYYSSTATGSVTSPPQVYGGQTFTSNISFSLVKTMMPSQPVDSSELNITLPAGLNYVGNAKFNGVAAQSAVQTGQVLQIRQKGYASVEYFSFDIQYTCGTSGTLSIPYELDYVMDRSCNAYERWVCGSYSVLAICGSTCSAIDNIQPQCTRLSLGYTDSTLTTKVSAASLSATSLISVMPLDTFRMVQGGTEGGSYSNLYYYFQAGKAVSSTDIIQFVSGSINYKAGGTGPTITCTLPSYTSLSTSTLTKYQWNLTPLLGGACGLPATLAAGDSIWVDIVFYVSNGGNNSLLYGSSLNQIPNAQCYFYNLDALSNPVFCNAWIPNLYVSGISAATVSLGTTNYSFTACTPTTITIFDKVGLVGDNYDLFPNEWRPIDYVDTLVLTMPTGASWSGGACVFNARRWASRFSLSNYQRAITPIVRGNQLVFANPGNFPYSDIFATTSTGSYVTIPIIANCAFSGGDVSVDLYARESYYAAPNSVARHPTFSSAGGFVYNSTLRPTITVQNNTGLVQGVLAQHYWDVQINNPSTRTAPYIWMALEPTTGSGISIDSVVLKPSNAVLMPAAYGTSSKWYSISTAGLATGTNQQARVYFKTTKCSLDSILMKAGWNCTGYPSPDPLSDANACSVGTQYLKVDPQPSEIQLSVSRQPGNGGTMSLCTTDSVLVVVNSAQGGYIISPYVNVFPPAGSTLSLPVKIEYPLGSGNYQNASVTTLTGGGYKIDLTSHTGIGGNGIPGVVSNPGTAGRQAKIRVDFSTDCSVSSGSPLNFFAYANMPCGQPATGNAVNVQTSGISITGATATGAMGLTISTSGSSMNCGQTLTVTASATPVLVATQSGDTVVYDLGNGLSYGGTFTPGVNCTSCTLSTAIGGTGNNLVKVALQTSVAAGSPMVFSFSIAPFGTGCGVANITGTAKRDITPLYCGAIACNSSTAAIGNVLSSAITTSKPNLSITGVYLTSGNYYPGGSPAFSVSIANTGTTNAATSTYQVEFFCGNNTTPFDTKYFPAAVSAGSSATAGITVAVPTVPACNWGQIVTAKIQPVMASAQQQCMCSATSYAMASPLPVELTGFNVRSVGCNALLSWSVAAEHGMASYETERSTDGNSFSAAGNIIASGRRTYSTTDSLLPVAATMLYYRLRMINTDGSSAYSNIVSFSKAKGCGGGLSRINVYPNPATNELWIMMEGEARYSIIDGLGRMVRQDVLLSGSGAHRLDVGRLPTGIYTLRIVQDGNVTVHQVQIVK